MKKQDALLMFDSVQELANLLNVTVQAIYGWPDVLSRRIADRVELAAIKRKKLRAPKRKGAGAHPKAGV